MRETLHIYGLSFQEILLILIFAQKFHEYFFIDLNEISLCLFNFKKDVFPEQQISS